MSVHEIPGLDLAKLVLGYLAEEQLMTAYDEFLQSSPYLDALENEYDRIFMTSLKHIVSEYRAVRIQVETCQPSNLRKKLLQCGSILEMIKFLINNVDLQRIGLLTSPAVESRSKRESRLFVQSKTSTDTSRSSNVETTPLADLPGYNVKKQQATIKTNKLNIEVPFQTINVSQDSTIRNEDTQIISDTFDYKSPVEHIQNKSHLEGSVQDACSLSMRTHTVNIDPKMSVISREPVTTGAPHNTNLDSTHNSLQPTRYSGPSCITNVDKPNLTHIELPPTPRSSRKSISDVKEIKIFPKPAPAKSDENQQKHDIGAPAKKQYLLQITSKNTNSPQKDSHKINLQNHRNIEQKVTIISDVKLDKSLPNISNLMNTNEVASHNFTSDEIMAMPTIFIVPSTAPPLLSPISQSQPSSVQIPTSQGSTASTVPSLGPLTIDITNSPKNTTTHEPPSSTATTQSKFIAALDMKSLPKEVVGVGKNGTPQTIPVVRKSSSTPRRSSHVRVLDFTTPRRILQETIHEHGFNNNEVVISGSPNLVICENQQPAEQIYPKECPQTPVVDKTAKENKVVPVKKQNWDADLRALLSNDTHVPAKSNQINKSPAPNKLKTKIKSTKKKKTPEKVKEEIPQGSAKKSSRRSTSQKSPKVKIQKSSVPKSNKKKRKSSDKKEEPISASTIEPVQIPVKPTINIVTDWNPSPPKDGNKSQNKSNSDEQNDTPDVDRISLQNVIGAKLNISDLLETPYKQALYDIQMDTPRFLQPDIPVDGPVSDVKITDIPTPRFLCSAPGPATPAYNSRPTDYSSGGSYYKPDEQDYPILDLDTVDLPKIKTNKNTTKTPRNKHKQEDKPRRSLNKSPRPVRKCTKNVSYTDNQSKHPENKLNAERSCSESSYCDEDINQQTIIHKTPRPKSNSNSANKRKMSPKHKKISPKKFMRIKPRKSTQHTKSHSSSTSNNTPKSLHRKSTYSKDKIESSVNSTPAPTKSRRKSSTPRKINTKNIITTSPDEISPDNIKVDAQKFTMPSANADSDTDNVPLRWSDDGSRSRASSEVNDNSAQSKPTPNHESEDLTKIKEYLAQSSGTPRVALDDECGSLHLDLIRRGFDVETAKSIERDLLDGSTSTNLGATSSKVIVPVVSEAIMVRGLSNDPAEVLIITETVPDSKDDIKVPKDNALKPDILNNSESLQEDEDEEIELSAHDCNEDTENYFTCAHNVNSKSSNKPVTFKDSYSMEVCIEEETIRLRTGPLVTLFNEEPNETETISSVETEAAVNSISNMERLYTPMKDHRASIQAQCIEIFDSTLTSLDTPLKSPPRNENVTMTEIILEVEKIVEKPSVDDKSKVSKKRKRIQSSSGSDESLNDTKKNKREARFIPNIQNIDIESVLSKLHGP